MTYRELLNYLHQLSEEQLGCNVAVESDDGKKEYSLSVEIGIRESKVVGFEYPVISVDFRR